MGFRVGGCDCGHVKCEMSNVKCWLSALRILSNRLTYRPFRVYIASFGVECRPLRGLDGAGGGFGVHALTGEATV